MPIPQDHVDKLLADCGRRCCICRRFRPLHLQVHHIQPREEGGTNDPDNLIALCVTCHSSVHTKTRMTRNFTVAELRQHRDNTVKAVRDGRLVRGPEPPGAYRAASDGLQAGISPVPTGDAAPRMRLPPEAAEVLLAAVRCGGRLVEIRYDGGWILQCMPDAEIPQGGVRQHGTAQFGGGADHRTQALYREAFGQLVEIGLVTPAGDNWFDVSHDGYLLADQLIAEEELRQVGSKTGT